MDYTFIINVTDKSVLNTKEYAELLSYIGIDFEQIAPDTNYIIATPAAGEYQYLQFLGSEWDEYAAIESSYSFLVILANDKRMYYYNLQTDYIIE